MLKNGAPPHNFRPSLTQGILYGSESNSKSYHSLLHGITGISIL